MPRSSSAVTPAPAGLTDARSARRPALRPARRAARHWAVGATLGALLLSAGACSASAGTDHGAASRTAASAPTAAAGSLATSSPSATASPSPTSTPTAAPSASRTAPATTSAGAKHATGTALAVLATLPVKGRAPMTGYSRDQFGPAWADVDHNGCDTRNDVLARDLTHRTTKAGTHDCIVLTGTLADPYSGEAISFVRGVKTSTAVQIDHVVALADAWQTGAQQLSATQREDYANDPYVLLAADGPLNEQKGAGDAATWLPPNKAFRCQYVARQIGIKHTYHLWVTAAEHDAMTYVLSSCPDQRVPAGGGAVVVVTGKAATSTAAPKAAAPKKTTAPKIVPPVSHPSVAKPVSHWDCPAWAPIKGNASSHIYHVPGGEYYARTAPEVCFSTGAAAVADGYRASQR